MTTRNPPTPGASDEDAGFNPFPIVGIGASAGGLEAFTQLLENLPARTGMAFILVQHLDPRHISHLRDLLEKASKLPVLDVVQGMKVEPDHVYVIPPNVDLTLEKGALLMTTRADTRAPHLSIDHFFRSLAAEQRSYAIGVLLSGSGSDGAMGMTEIKAVGGITFAQSEGSARHYSMPRSAIDSGSVDFVLPAEQIAQRLAQIGGHPYLLENKGEPDEDDGEDFRRVLTAVRGATGVDFTHYRDTTIRRRIHRRMALDGARSLGAYADRLVSDRDEVEALYRDVLINVTSFFRDPGMFEVLKEQVFPVILEAKGAKQPIRIWVPGCSTGQEPYSIAMALVEFLDDKPSRPDIQIFATDLADLTALDKARAGIYPDTIQSEVSPERLRRFFHHEDHVYRIQKSIRDLCIFARQNVAADPPFSHIDLISCRNVLIYMSAALQKHVLPMFHYALDVPGFLVLGSSESVGQQSDLFDLVERANRVYAKKAAAHRPLLAFATPPQQAIGGPLRGALQLTASDFNQEADRILVGRYVPPGVLVTDDFEILQFRGDTSPYLQTPAGEPTTNLLRMVREGLFLEIRSALADAKKTNQAVVRPGVIVTDRHGVTATSLRVIPVRPPRADRACYLVLFEDGDDAADRHEVEAAGSSETKEGAEPRRGPSRRRKRPGGGEEARLGDESGPQATEAERELVRLRHEFTVTKEYLQSISEQQDAANEELRAANEEILSSNEELQSTNEELETAKEELQSTNEELTTVNDQLQHRNAELSTLSNDLSNVLSSTAIPLVMVGNDLRVRRLTPAARKILNLLPSDVGRPIGEIRPSLTVTSLDSLIAKVIDEVKMLEQEVRDEEGAWWILRIFPYRTSDHHIDGAVVCLIDVNQVKRAEEEWREALDYSSAILQTSHEPMLVLDEELRVVSANRAFSEKFGVPASQLEGRPFAAEPNQQWDIPEVHRLLDDVRKTRRDVDDFAIQHEFPSLGARSLLLNVRVLDRGAKPSLTMLSIQDVTDRQHEVEARAAVDARDRFLAMMSHEIRNPLAAMDTATRMLRLQAEEPVVEKARATLERQLSHLIRLVDDFLEVSRLDHSKVHLRRRPVDVADALRNAVDAVKPMVAAHPHVIEVVPPPEPLRADADPMRLEQILVNLVANAIKFSGEGGAIELRAGAEPSAAAGGRDVVIRVRDNGMGMKPELMARMFEDFAQGEGSEDRGGLGLGLALVKRLVELHGGAVEASSGGEGKGTEVRVRLPEATAGSAAPTVEPDRAQPLATAASGRRILVVEDNQDAANMLGMLLERLGHQVRIAHDGPSALAAIREAAPEFALIDVGLPGMSGYDVAREIRKIPDAEAVTLIAHTGYAQASDRDRARAAGFDHHMVKPLDWQALQRLLDAGSSSN